MLGYVLEYNKSTSYGTVVDSEGKHYSFNASGMLNLNYVDAFDNVTFDIEENVGDSWVAINIKLVEGEDEECEHEFDFDEGGMCLNCGADDWYNHYDEDYGQDR